MVGETVDADVKGPRARGMQALHLVRRGGPSADTQSIGSLDDVMALLDGARAPIRYPWEQDASRIGSLT